MKRRFSIAYSSTAVHKGERGVILLVTMWIALVLGIIAYSLSFQVRMEMKLAKQYREDAQAQALVQAGVAKAVADLKNDLLLDTSEGGEIFDAEGDVWAQREDKTDIELGNGTFTVWVIDQNSRLNLNTVDLNVLKKILLMLDVKEDDVEKIAHAIIDWRDTDEKPSGGKGEIENKYYSELVREDSDRQYYGDEKDKIIYHCKNDNFTTVEELLDVYGVTPELFYGYNPQERLEQLLSWKKRDEDREIPLGLYDFFTVTSDGTLNVNTATLEVLTAVIEGSGIDESDAEGMAEEIIDYRRKNRTRKIDNDQAFRSWRQLTEVSGISGSAVRRIYAAQRLSTTSSNYQIISIGRVGEVEHKAKVDVVRRMESFNLDEGYGDDERRKARRRRARRESDRDDDFLIKEPTIRVINWLEP